MINSDISNITQKWVDILKPFTSNYITKLTSTQIAKLTDIPQQTVSRVLNELEVINIIQSKTEGRNKYYYFNLNNHQSTIILEIVEQKKAIDFILNKPKINTIIEDVIKNCDSVILFGSYSSNKETKNSDLDLIIINGKEDKIKEIKDINTIEINYENLKYSELKQSINKQLPLAKEIENNHIFFGNVSKLVRLYIKV